MRFKHYSRTYYGVLGEKDEEVSFALVKEKLSTSSVLALPKFDKLFDVKYDTSSKGIRVVLSQKGRPIEYISEKLNEHGRSDLFTTKSFIPFLGHSRCRHII